MKRCSLAIPISIAQLLVSSARADVIDVGGPSPDYPQITGAVMAAADGDVIRVWPGNYQPFTVLNESLTIVKATSTGSVHVNGTVRIRELSSGRSVLLGGIDATGSDGRGLVVSDCLGSVRIREGEFTGANNDGAAWPYDGHDGALITGCRDVELIGCALVGGSPTYGEYGGSGGRGLLLVESTLTAFDCLFQGTDGSTDDDPGAGGYPGGAGVEAWDPSHAYLSGCTLVGGDGGDADYDPDWFGDYGYGGRGGYGFLGYSNADAWFLDDVYQPGSGGSSPDPSNQGQPGQATNGGNFLPGLSRQFSASALVDDQTEVALRFQGAPGDQLFLRIAPGADYQFSPVLGPLLVAAAPLAPFGVERLFSPYLGWRFMGTLGATGVLNTTLPASELPNLGQRLLHAQAGFVGAETYLGSSSWTAVLDTAW